jgi:hypothetical protein
MQSVLYVDSRMRSEGTDSSFQIDLQESKHLDSHGMRLDKIRFVNTFFTTDLGAHLYYKDGSGGLQHYTVPAQAYTGALLAAAIQTATSRTTTYDSNTNAITQAINVGQEWLSDEALKAYSAGFPAGASGVEPRSLNTILGPATAGANLVWGFVTMAPYEYLFLRSRRLTIENCQDPNGRHDAIAMIPLVNGIGAVEHSASPEGVYMKLPTDLTLRNIDFSLTDYKGKNVNLRGRPLSFEICFD